MLSCRKANYFVLFVVFTRTQQEWREERRRRREEKDKFNYSEVFSTSPGQLLLLPQVFRSCLASSSDSFPFSSLEPSSSASAGDRSPLLVEFFSWEMGPCSFWLVVALVCGGKFLSDSTHFVQM